MRNHPPPPPPPAPPGPDEVSWEDLERLAAGEAEDRVATALRERIAADPALSARFERTLEVERLLRDPSLLPLPAGLVVRVLGGLPARRPLRLLPALARFAAAVLLALGACVAVEGTIPSLALAETPPVLAEAAGPVLALVPPPAVDVGDLPAGLGTDAPAPALLEPGPRSSGRVSSSPAGPAAARPALPPTRRRSIPHGPSPWPRPRPDPWPSCSSRGPPWPGPPWPPTNRRLRPRPRPAAG